MLSRLMTVREQWLLLGVAGAIVLGSAVLLWQGTAESTHSPDTFVPRADGAVTAPTIAPARQVVTVTTPSPPPPEAPEQIAVGILGAVAEEGLYYFDPGARLSDLLEAAGGTLPESDLSDVNRTALLIDETTLLVPMLFVEDGVTYSYPEITYNPPAYTRSAWYRFDDPAPGTDALATGSSSAASYESAGGLVNLNTASQDELEKLPGVGPATALKIIAYRESQPFTTPGDLEKVSGIGPTKMATLATLVTVD